MNCAPTNNEGETGAACCASTEGASIEGKDRWARHAVPILDLRRWYTRAHEQPIWI